MTAAITSPAAQNDHAGHRICRDVSYDTTTGEMFDCCINDGDLIPTGIITWGAAGADPRKRDA